MENKTKRKAFLKIAILSGLLAAMIAGGYILLQLTSNTQDEIITAQANVEKIIRNLGKSDPKDSSFETVGISWYDVELALGYLSNSNREIAEAKAMIQIEPYAKNISDSLSWSSTTWAQRYQLSERPWKLETMGQRVSHSLEFGGMVGIITAIVILTISLFTSWAWYFLLARVKEVGSALRGG